MNAWKTSQIESLESATNWGMHWDLDDLNLVANSMDETVALVAEVLERTVYAISTIRGLIRAGYTPAQIKTSPVVKVERVCKVCNMVAPLAGCC